MATTQKPSIALLYKKTKKVIHNSSLNWEQPIPKRRGIITSLVPFYNDMPYTLKFLLPLSFHVQLLHITAMVIAVRKIPLYAIIKNDIELTI